MTIETLHQQVGRPGPVLCHYEVESREFGYRVSRGHCGVLFSFGWRGHAFAVGWMVR